MNLLVVGIDLGGTEIKAGLVDSEKGIIKKTLLTKPTILKRVQIGCRSTDFFDFSFFYYF